MAQTFDFDIGNVVGPPGATGNGIKSIQLLSTSGRIKTYRITFTDDTTFDFSVSDGEDGDDGNGISGASFDPQTNALTITFDDGTSFTTPSLKGSPGTPGDDGYSPAITIETITGGHRVTITDKAHQSGQSFDVMDGANDAGSVTYDETATYQAGTVGAELSNQSRHLSDLEDSISDAYDATASYAVGDFCINENTLYRCNTAIPTGGEAWTPSHWDAVQIVDQLNDLEDDKQDKTNYVTVSGTVVTQVGADNTMYLCGELAELTFTAQATGQTAIRFTSGTTPTVATFTGVTWLNGFDPSSLEANKTYEINVLNGLGVAAWT